MSTGRSDRDGCAQVKIISAVTIRRQRGKIISDGCAQVMINSRDGMPAVKINFRDGCAQVVTPDHPEQRREHAHA